MTDLVEDTIDRLSHHPSDEIMMGDSFSNHGETAFLPRKSSNVSLFSLATHFTASSTTSSSSQQPRQSPPGAISFQGGGGSHGGGEQEESCAWRLHHIPSGTLVTPENYPKFIAHGEMYNHVAKLCMQVAQTTMMEQGNLHWVSICNARGIEALVSNNIQVQQDFTHCDWKGTCASGNLFQTTFTNDWNGILNGIATDTRSSHKGNGDCPVGSKCQWS